MCTVSLTYSDQSRTWFLGGNRDEQKARKTGLPPEQKSARGVRYLAPTDTVAGGTWIAVNENRFALAILNRYSGNIEAGQLPENPPSRGKIIPALIHLSSVPEIEKAFEGEINPKHYHPFTLLAVDFKNGSIRRWDWNGEKFSSEKNFVPPVLWVSSGYDQGKVEEIRNELFRSYLEESDSLDAGLIKKIHSSDKPERGPISIAMEYEHVQTVSSTIVECGERIGMHHTNGLPRPDSQWKFTDLLR